MSLTAIVWIITIVFCGIFLWISVKVKDSAGQSFSNYAIAGGTLPIYLILFTDIATIMGAGNFIGHAAQGYKIGLVDIPFVFGEQGSKIIFALVFAGLAGKFTYNTLSEMMDDLLVRDKVTRALVGVLTASIMIAWVGGQGKGLGDIFAAFTGANPIPIIMLFNAVFIIYTFLGGIYSVVWTDLMQGIIVVVFAFIFYGFAFAPVHFSMGVLQQKLAEVGAANLGTLSNVPFAVILKNFITGCFGILAEVLCSQGFRYRQKRHAGQRHSGGHLCEHDSHGRPCDKGIEPQPCGSKPGHALAHDELCSHMGAGGGVYTDPGCSHVQCRLQPKLGFHNPCK